MCIRDRNSTFAWPELSDEAINFNPALTFDGDDQMEDSDAEDYLEDLTAVSTFAVVDSGRQVFNIILSIRIFHLVITIKGKGGVKVYRFIA